MHSTAWVLEGRGGILVGNVLPVGYINCVSSAVSCKLYKLCELYKLCNSVRSFTFILRSLLTSGTLGGNVLPIYVCVS